MPLVFPASLQLISRTLSAPINWPSLRPILASSESTLLATKYLASLSPRRETLFKHINKSTEAALIVTILERCLYSLYKSRAKTKRNMILRDLIASHEISQILAPECVAVLETLFLPTGLNIRNLVWHGFIIETEIHESYLDLMVLIICDLSGLNQSDILDAGKSDGTAWSIRSFDNHPNLQKYHDFPQAAGNVLQSLNTHEFIDSTSFVPDTHKGLLKHGITFLKNGQELLFLFSSLPVLEHSIRCLFSSENNVPDIALAHTDSYFSTLDGFGQKHKHQILLDPLVLATGDENKILALLNFGDGDRDVAGCLAVLLDLFLMERGPSVRGKLCHGEACLDSLFIGDSNGMSVLTSMVFLTITSLCSRFSKQGETEVSILKDTHIIDSYRLSFHPISYLRQSIKLVASNQNSLENLIRESTCTIEQDDFDISQSRASVFLNGATVEYVDKTNRLQPTDSEPSTLPSLIYNLNNLLEMELESLHQGLVNYSQFQESSIFMKPEIASVLPNGYLQKFKYTQSMPYGSCLLSIVDVVLQTQNYFLETIFKSTLEKILSKAARTSQRRALFIHYRALPAMLKLFRYVLIWLEFAIFQSCVITDLKTSTDLISKLPFPKLFESVKSCTSFADPKGGATLEKGVLAGIDFLMRGKTVGAFRKFLEIQRANQ
ncbi:hypothetical protein BDR26DRAFT_879891 [Obelidium mucronatum]|nr:hypothetical protein BDR26DRAFT_879891 [Obelidium mucronatum]